MEQLKNGLEGLRKRGKFRSASGSLGKAIYFWGDEEYLERIGLAWASIALRKGLMEVFRGYYPYFLLKL